MAGSHNRTEASAVAVASTLRPPPMVTTVICSTSHGWRSTDRRQWRRSGRPVTGSQSRTAASSPLVANTVRPSAKDTVRIVSTTRWPVAMGLPTGWPVAGSHSRRTAPSPLVANRMRPSGSGTGATSYTSRCAPLEWTIHGSPTACPLMASHRRTVASPLPLASRDATRLTLQVSARPRNHPPIATQARRVGGNRRPPPARQPSQQSRSNDLLGHPPEDPGADVVGGTLRSPPASKADNDLLDLVGTILLQPSWHRTRHPRSV